MDDGSQKFLEIQNKVETKSLKISQPFENLSNYLEYVSKTSPNSLKIPQTLSKISQQSPKSLKKSPQNLFKKRATSRKMYQNLEIAVKSWKVPKSSGNALRHSRMLQTVPGLFLDDF